MFRTYCDAPNSRRRPTYWARPSLNWLKRQRWLLQQPSSGQWLANLLPGEQPGQWQPVWTDRVAAGLQFATEEMAGRVFRNVSERIHEELELRAVTFIAPPSAPTAWRPLDE